jgi:DNA-binding NarL/FixJ family response regulator
MTDNLSSILVVEDELITAESISQLLEEEEHIIAGIAKDAATALLICQQASPPPSVIVCDINIKGPVKGIVLAQQLKQMYACEIIFLTAYADSNTLQDAFATDPVMYVVKPYTDKQLLVAVQMAFHRLFNRQQKQVMGGLQLTEREKEIAGMVAQGFSSKQICMRLGISIETVKTHRRRMLQKNNISNFPQLVYLMNQPA